MYSDDTNRKIPVCGRVKNAVSQSYYPAQHSTSAAGNSSQYAHQNHDNAANADTAKRDIHDSASRFLTPGFRTRTPWKMLLSSVAYLFIIWLCLTLEIENTYGAKLWLERIFALVCSYLQFSVALTISMYKIYCHFARAKPLPALCRHNTAWCGSDFALFVIMFIIESVAFPIKWFLYHST